MRWGGDIALTQSSNTLTWTHYVCAEIYIAGKNKWTAVRLREGWHLQQYPFPPPRELYYLRVIFLRAGEIFCTFDRTTNDTRRTRWAFLRARGARVAHRRCEILKTIGRCTSSRHECYLTSLALARQWRGSWLGVGKSSSWRCKGVVDILGQRRRRRCRRVRRFNVQT